MQPNQQERKFQDAPLQPPMYRFPQNQPSQGWQPQQTFSQAEEQNDDYLTSRLQKGKSNQKCKPRRRIFTWWNLFAVIGLFTLIIQTARYVIIPLLVYLNVLTGGAA